VAHVSLRIERHDAAVTVALDRPDVLNALDGPLIAALTAAFEDAASDPTVRVVVLTGEGRAFCAGADIAWMQKMGESSLEANVEDARRLAALMQAIDRCPKPTIARINGSAFGGALGLVACCDIAIAVRSAVVAASEVRLGVIPAVITPYLIRAMGARSVRRLVVTAERISAAEALRLGLLHEVVEGEDIDVAVRRAVKSCLAGGPAAIAAAKTLVADLSGSVSDEVAAETAGRIAAIRATDEAREGLAAFLERRKPEWVPR
jgi:methylglutaconyl-CoA hydratase